MYLSFSFISTSLATHKRKTLWSWRFVSFPIFSLQSSHSRISIHESWLILFRTATTPSICGARTSLWSKPTLQNCPLAVFPYCFAPITHSGKYLALTTSKDTGRSNRLWIAELDTQPLGPNMKWDKIVDEFGSEFNLVANDHSRLYIMTNKDAPKRKGMWYLSLSSGRWNHIDQQ